MGRSPCCLKQGLNRGAWTAEEDRILTDYITTHGEGKWRNLPTRAGLKRCGKSCRLRWLNYLRPGIKRGNISPDEEDLIIRLHNLLGNRWSLIAGRLPGRTDNEIKNYWNTNLAKKVKQKNLNQAYSSQSHVVRPKATKCSKVLMHFHINNSNYKAEPEAEGLSAAAPNNNTCSHQIMEPCSNIGFSSFPCSDGNEISTDLVLVDDFEMAGDICFSDLLNSDFNFSSDMLCDFSYHNNINNISHGLSLPACNSDQVPLLFSDEILNEYWTQSDFADITK